MIDANRRSTMRESGVALKSIGRLIGTVCAIGRGYSLTASNVQQYEPPRRNRLARSRSRTDQSHLPRGHGQCTTPRPLHLGPRRRVRGAPTSRSRSSSSRIRLTSSATSSANVTAATTTGIELLRRRVRHGEVQTLSAQSRRSRVDGERQRRGPEAGSTPSRIDFTERPSDAPRPGQAGQSQITSSGSMIPLPLMSHPGCQPTSANHVF